ncbi:hypothetical protein HK104_009261 [Borealophlyctis nickersoniae]|nr:hypothetical protein HK104_009261 [Borealophlyctis nickersoniae]
MAEVARRSVAGGRSSTTAPPSIREGRSSVSSTSRREPVKSEEPEDDDDDDEEEEDDDEDEEDEEAPKRTLKAKWTLEEQSAVLNFYGLQTLFPQTWVEDSTDRALPSKVPSMIMPMEAVNIPLPAALEQAVDLSDPLGIKESIYGRGRRRRSMAPGASELGQLDNLLISSKKFDPKHFLREVHRSTSYRDFELGAERLQGAIDDRMEVIKNLVKTHFAKFVNAKSTIDSFYQEMRRQNLISSEDYGIAPFAKSIDALGTDAATLYAPMLERRRKAEKIRITLGVLEQWKFFFNLPSVLQDLVQKGKYDAAVRDYKKGRYLMQSSFEQSESPSSPVNLATSPTPREIRDKEKDSLLPQHHRKVFEKVWIEVENIVERLRQDLFRLLGDPWTPLDVQERNILHLIELDAETDPVWFYLESQYKWILTQLTDAYEAHVHKLNAFLQTTHPTEVTPWTEPDESDEEDVDPEAEYRKPKRFFTQMTGGRHGVTVRPSRPLSLPEFKKAIGTVKTRDYERVMAEDMDMQLWKATLRLVRVLCNTLVNCLPDFWKVCRMFSEGRLQKAQARVGELEMPPPARGKRRADTKKLEQCQLMIRNILELYSLLLSHAFFLTTPLSALPSSVRNHSPDLAQRPPHVRLDSMSLASPSTLVGSDTASPSSAVTTTDSTLISPASHSASTPSDVTSPQPQQPHSITTVSPISSTLTDSNASTSSPADANQPPLPTAGEVHFIGNAGGGAFPSIRGVPRPPILNVALATFLRCHPLTACYFVTRLMGEFAKCFGAVRDMRLSGANTVLAVLVDVVEKIRGRAVEGICEGVLEESKRFYQYEDWTFDSDPTSSLPATSSPKKPLQANAVSIDTTTHLKLVYRFHRHAIRSLQRIIFTPISLVNGNLPSTDGSTDASLAEIGKREQQNVRRGVERAREMLFGGLYGVLDGLEFLATRWKKGRDGGEGGDGLDSEDGVQNVTGVAVRAKLQAADVQVANGAGAAGGGSLGGWKRKRKVVDVRQVDTRTLLVISNLSYMRQIMVPKLVTLFEEKFNVRTAGDTKNLEDTSDHLDTLLFQNYIRRKCIKVHDILRNGILFSGLAWNDLPRPQEIRSYCYQILLALVMAHAEVSDVSRLLVRRVLCELLHYVAQDLLTSFRQVDQFSPGGMLQATLETEFLHQTLSSYETPESSTILALVYDTVERGTKQDGSVGSTTTPAMNDMLESVKAFLEEAKNATSVQFSCFREDGGGGGETEGPTEGEGGLETVGSSVVET